MSSARPQSKEVGVCSRCGQALRAPVADGIALCPQCLGAAPDGQEGSGQPDPLVGQRVGDLAIHERIGGGAQCGVYRARQVSLGRVVAVKALCEEAGGDAWAVAQLEHEARASAAVVHPNVVRTHWLWCEGERRFLVMEHVAGETLASLIARSGRLPPAYVLGLMQQLTAAVAKAHEAGVLHCAIEPANVLVTARGVAKLGDFGQARRRGEALALRPDGDCATIPLYYPPEAARGRRLDERSDLFLLGGTFYHALSGRPPFDGDDAEERALLYIRNEAPPLDRALRKAPIALCRTVHKMLRRDPDERYASAAEALEVLGRLAAMLGKSRAEAADSGPVWAQPARGNAATRPAPRVAAAIVGGPPRPSPEANLREVVNLPEGAAARRPKIEHEHERTSGRLATSRREARPAAAAARGSPKAGERRKSDGERLTLAERADAKKQQRRRQRRTAIIGGAAGLAILCALLVVLSRPRGRTRAAARPAVPATRRAGAPPPVAPRAPRPPPAPRGPEPVLIELRAKDASIHGMGAKYEEGDGKDNIGYWHGEDATVSWTFRIEVPATYKVEVVFAATRDAAGQDYAVRMAGQEVIGTVRRTDGWTDFVTEEIGTVAIGRRGRYTLSVEPRKKRHPRAPLMNLQAVRLVPAKAGTTPGGGG